MCKMDLEQGDIYSTPKGDIRVESVTKYDDGYVEVTYNQIDTGESTTRAAIFLRTLIAKNDWIWQRKDDEHL